jgi:hypothetical protein
MKVLAGYPSNKPKSGGSSNIVSDIAIVKSKHSPKPGSKDGSTASGSAVQSQADNNSQNLALEDSFEKFYNKDLDLEEDQVPVVIYELNESALNFIS